MRTVITKWHEYKIGIVQLLIEFEKSFTGMVDVKLINSRYFNTFREESTRKFRIDWGERHSDTIEPELFPLILESAFRRLDCSEMEITKNGEYLSRRWYRSNGSWSRSDPGHVTNSQEKLVKWNCRKRKSRETLTMTVTLKFVDSR